MTRPAIPDARELLIILPRALIAKAKLIGQGNASKGIRAALTKVRLPKPAPVAQSLENLK